MYYIYPRRKTAHIIVTHPENIRAFMNYLSENSLRNTLDIKKHIADCAIASGVVIKGRIIFT